MKKYLTIATYLATIPAANWMINNIGTQTFPGGPHTIPVGFGYSAPSGVLLIGIALFARDYIQDQYGRNKTIIAIIAGIILSYIINPAVATASAVAFALGELADFAIYTRIRKHSKPTAILASGTIGGIIDSFVFLQIAFGSTNFWQGQVIGKTLIAVTAALIIKLSHDLPKRLSPQQA